MIGTKGYAETEVTEENTASAAGSGSLQVFGTPYMIALIEKAASESVLPFISEEESTVGTRLDVAHTSATPLGLKVWAESELVAADGKKLTFSVKAFDSAGEIGKGVHERYIIKIGRFMEKALRKTDSGKKQ